MVDRKSRFLSWLSSCFPKSEIKLTSVDGDAGFRQYFRFLVHGKAYIAVDAPPKFSNNQAFVDLSHCFAEHNIHAPQVMFFDLSEGFLIIEDFGSEVFANMLSEDNADELYSKAMAIALAIAKIEQSESSALPVYDRAFIQRECEIFPEWLLGVHLSLNLTEEEKGSLQACFNFLIESALEQPKVTMHRDFHSRNLMVLASGDIGTIDFQDAVVGPVTYDLVSLLRDCYVAWPAERVKKWLNEYFELAQGEHLIDVDISQFERWFDLMGIQRHVKAAGIFARLLHRDNKTGYIKDIPQTLTYIIDVGRKYEELSFLVSYIEKKVVPALSSIQLKKFAS